MENPKELISDIETECGDLEIDLIEELNENLTITLTFD